MMGLRARRSGVSILIVTVMLVPMLAMTSLAVDLGHAFWRRRAAQAAADAAALAAVAVAADGAATLEEFKCASGRVQCRTTPAPCPATGNLHAACLLLERNGVDLSATDHLVQAGDIESTPPTVMSLRATADGGTVAMYSPPGAPNVDVFYWVSVSVTYRLPAVFAIFAGQDSIPAKARATAAATRTEVKGSVVLLNRQNDTFGSNEPRGANLVMNGGGLIKAPGICLASNKPAWGQEGAGTILGTGVVDVPWTRMRNEAQIGGNHPENWLGKPIRGEDSEWLKDPMRRLGGQPPVNPSTSDYHPIEVRNGKAEITRNSAGCTDGVCRPGNYYAVSPQAGCTDLASACAPATGQPLSVGDSITFQSSSRFDDFVFFGGLAIRGTQVTFGDGRFVIAGVRNSSTPVFDIDNKALIQSTAGGPGRMFVLTDGSYEGRLDAAVAGIPNPLQWTGANSGSLGFGPASLKSGATDGSYIELFGLDPNDSAVAAAGLKDYAPMLIWQDQRNSRVKYQTPDGRSNGQIDVSCGSLDSPCTNSLADPDTPRLDLWASSHSVYSGVIYQPRGAWMYLVGTSNYRGSLKFVTGAISVSGGGSITLSSPLTPLTTVAVALVE